MTEKIKNLVCQRATSFSEFAVHFLSPCNSSHNKELSAVTSPQTSTLNCLWPELQQIIHLESRISNPHHSCLAAALSFPLYDPQNPLPVPSVLHCISSLVSVLRSSYSPDCTIPHYAIPWLL